jgi:hypothetical protein
MRCWQDSHARAATRLPHIPHPNQPRRAARGLANANAVYAIAVTVIAQYSTVPNQKKKKKIVQHCTVYRIFFATPLARLPNSENDTLPLTVLQKP